MTNFLGSCEYPEIAHKTLICKFLFFFPDSSFQHFLKEECNTSLKTAYILEM